MSVEKQLEFVLRLLEESATSVGIDIEKSGYGLMEVHNRLAKLEQSFDDDDLREADALLSRFGKSEIGLKMLYALGEACVYANGWTWAARVLNCIEI
jgi:hypothetical protein